MNQELKSIEPSYRKERQLKTINANKIQAESEKLKKGSVVFKNFNGFWKKDSDKPALKNCNFYFESPKLYCISGKIASGKSSLLQAIYG